MVRFATRHCKAGNLLRYVNNTRVSQKVPARWSLFFSAMAPMRKAHTTVVTEPSYCCSDAFHLGLAPQASSTWPLRLLHALKRAACSRILRAKVTEGTEIHRRLSVTCILPQWTDMLKSGGTRVATEEERTGPQSTSDR